MLEGWCWRAGGREGWWGLGRAAGWGKKRVAPPPPPATRTTALLFGVFVGGGAPLLDRMHLPGDPRAARTSLLEVDGGLPLPHATALARMQRTLGASAAHAAREGKREGEGARGW